jgi:CxxC motif-containing protein (DUF1111 family)
MFQKARTFLRSIRIAVALLTVICLANVLQAQNASPSPTPTDPGPRPTGREALNNDPNAVCPVTGNKFPETVCLDFVQPPSPNIPADGAGQIVNNAGNLGGSWFQALTVFSTPASVNGTDNNNAAGKFIRGLGPSFNAESCFQCHSQPAVGGSSPGCVDVGTTTVCSNMNASPTTGQVTSTFSDTTNPQIIDATDRGAKNNVPFFVSDRSNTGPLLEARIPNGFGNGPSTLGNPASVPAGAVAELYVITGRTDAPANCSIVQEDFQSIGTIVFRIPIPTFGDGFVENTPETGLNAAATAAASEASSLGITGITFHKFNLSGNDQTITRFGWKAQNKSLLMFSGEASNVEMGVTNELFPTERTYGNAPDCTTNQLPEDVTKSLNANQIIAIAGPLPTPTPTPPDEPGVTSVISSNIENDSIFMRLNGAPSICDFASGVDSTTKLAQCLTVSTDQSVLRGAALFGNSILAAPTGTAPTNIGCVLCHWQTQTTGPSTTPTLSNASFHPFSDFALHHMGGLADGVTQGLADGDQFRTAPLWGLGQRLFFLHDGREPKNPPVAGQNPLFDTIQDHCLPVPSGSTAAVSEACGVVANFNNLPATCTNSTCTSSTGVVGSQQDIINFLRSL